MAVYMSHGRHDDPTDRARRTALRNTLAIAAGGIALIHPRQAPAAADPARDAFMARAYAMRERAVAQGDQPYGAVIVKDGRLVAEGVSAVITTNDPTAHAEMQAIRGAARALGTRDLSGCEMYGTSPACPMCEAAAYWARVTRLYYGMPVVDGGAPKLR